jgi:hypothetical protein
MNEYPYPTENDELSRLRLEQVWERAAMVAGLKAHGITATAPAYRELVRTINTVRRHHPEWLRTARSDARSIIAFRSAHVQDLVNDKGADADPCALCVTLGYTRPQRDAITAAQGHTEEELARLTQL